MGRTHRLISRLISLEVGIETGYGLNGRGVGVRVPVGLRIFYPPRRPHRFWGPTEVSKVACSGCRVITAEETEPQEER
jgi:hypothetical protein